MVARSRAERRDIRRLVTGVSIARPEKTLLTLLLLRGLPAKVILPELSSALLEFPQGLSGQLCPGANFVLTTFQLINS